MLYAIFQEANRVFAEVLQQFGRGAPSIVDIKLFIPSDAGRDGEFEATFSNGHCRRWRARNVSRWPSDLRDNWRHQFMRGYSRMFEDHQVDLQLTVMQAALEQLEISGVSPYRIGQYRHEMLEREEHIRRYHRNPPAMYFNGNAAGVEVWCSDSNYVGFDPGANCFVATRDNAGETVISYNGHQIAAQTIPVPDTPEYQALAEQMRREVERITGLSYGLPDEPSNPLAFADDVGTKESNERGIKLLKEWLSPAQLKQYEKRKHFDVIGSDSGKRYRIRHGRQMNIDELDADGKKVCGWCFLPEGNVVAGDVMLAQKLALETNEAHVLTTIANHIPLITGEVGRWRGMSFVDHLRPIRGQSADLMIVDDVVAS